MVLPKSLGLVSLDTKAMPQGNEQSSDIADGSFWSKLMEAQAKRRSGRQGKKLRRIVRGHVKAGGKRPTRILMRTMARLGSRKHANGIGRKVRTLKNLIPNGDSMELDGLFREAADYILSLQMRVRVMQIMVNLLSNSDE